jgi:hypothetical protein
MNVGAARQSIFFIVDTANVGNKVDGGCNVVLQITKSTNKRKIKPLK